jgi:hypothetical protein
MFQRFHRSARPNPLTLLRTVSKDHAFPPLSLLKDRELKWIIETGLGPLLCSASQKDLRTGESPLCRDVKAADLATRLINQIQLETLNEILVKCEGLFPPVTLLKGSSTGSEL